MRSTYCLLSLSYLPFRGPVAFVGFASSLLCCCELSGVITLIVREQGRINRVAKGRSKRNLLKIIKLYVLSQLIGLMLVGCDFKDSLLQPSPSSVIKIYAMIQLHLHKILESFNRFLVVCFVAILKPVYLTSGCLHFLLYLVSKARQHSLAAVLHYLLKAGRASSPYYLLISLYSLKALHL